MIKVFWLLGGEIVVISSLYEVVAANMLESVADMERL